MVVKRYGMGSKWRLLKEDATLLVMAQLLYYHVLVCNWRRMSANGQIATSLYYLTTCVEDPAAQTFKKPGKHSIS